MTQYNTPPAITAGPTQVSGSELVFTIAKWTVVYVFTQLGTHGFKPATIIGDDVKTSIATQITGYVIVVGTALLARWKLRKEAKQAALTGISLPKDSTLNTVNAAIAAGVAPSMSTAANEVPQAITDPAVIATK